MADGLNTGILVRAAGGVVWRRTSATTEILLVHRPKYDDWSLPKGKAEPGETDEQTALREVEEETGLVCSLGADLGSVHYTDHLGRPKVVRFWAMTVLAEHPWTPDHEVDALVWVSVPQARVKLSYERELPVLDTFEQQ